MKRLLLVRPEPGLTASATRARALGLEVILCPLFAVEAMAWDVPDAAEYDALLLTSANAVRHGGAGLQALASLPVWAVGEATAESARSAGFAVERVGTSGVEALLGTAPGARLLHLAGEEFREGPRDMARRIVYRSRVVEEPGLPALDGLVIAVHSPRAGRRLAELAQERSETAVAAISSAAGEAVGLGWEAVEVAEAPDDAALLALAARLCHKSPR